MSVLSKKQWLVGWGMLWGICWLGKVGAAPADSGVGTPPTGVRLGGVLPAVSYDADVGFRYGVLANFYDWGDGSTYPDYVRSLYLEASRTTKGSGQVMFAYEDRRWLGSTLRLAADGGYYVEQALDFYGFNGYEAVIHPEWADPASIDYRTRMFYRIDRRMWRLGLNFHLPIRGRRIRAMLGTWVGNVRIGPVNIERLNRNKTADERLPTHDSVPGLYEYYRRWGLIDSFEADGGAVGMLRMGMIYDTRTNEIWPDRGVWDEVILLGATEMGRHAKQYLQVVATHRHYIGIRPQRLLFAYRLAASVVVAGRAPFYMLPFYHGTVYSLQDGFGGRKTVRGVWRNRVVADGVAIGNFELRGRVLNTRLMGQAFYVALSGFVDAARVVRPRPVTVDSARVAQSGERVEEFFDADPERQTHLGLGAGIRFALNENFIVAVDYGKPISDQDGPGGLYINLGWLF